MQKLIFLLLTVAFLGCKKSYLEGNYSTCIKQKIESFIEKENSRSVQWVDFNGEAFYKFSTTGEDVYFDDRCNEVCRYAYISSFLPDCRLDLENAGAWTIIWQK